MAAVVAVAAAILLLKPHSDKQQQNSEQSALQEAIAEYGDAMAEEEAQRETERKAQWQQRHERKKAPQDKWNHEATHSDTVRWRQQYHERPSREKVSVELNSADSATLTTVRGIGPTFAQRIVRYRTRLGGFVRKEQLMEVWGIDSVRYKQIAPQLTVNTALVQQTDINSATADDLWKHPYLDKWQARELVAWRKRGHCYRSSDDLLKVNTIDSTTVARMEGYLRYGDSTAEQKQKTTNQ